MTERHGVYMSCITSSPCKRLRDLRPTKILLTFDVFYVLLKFTYGEEEDTYITSSRCNRLRIVRSAEIYTYCAYLYVLCTIYVLCVLLKFYFMRDLIQGHPPQKCVFLNLWSKHFEILFFLKNVTSHTRVSPCNTLKFLFLNLWSKHFNFFFTNVYLIDEHDAHIYYLMFIQ